MARYQTRDGDMLDMICYRHYGRQSEAVEAVLEANRGLADKGPVFAAGLIIDLPALSTPEAKVIQIWD